MGIIDGQVRRRDQRRTTIIWIHHRNFDVNSAQKYAERSSPTQIRLTFS